MVIFTPANVLPSCRDCIFVQEFLKEKIASSYISPLTMWANRYYYLLGLLLTVYGNILGPAISQMVRRNRIISEINQPNIFP